MALVHLDESFKNQLLCDWCGPQDYLAMVSSCKSWSDSRDIRNAAWFAVSRIHFPGCESWHAMAYWNTVWKQCVEVFNARGWSVAHWKDSCKIELDGQQCVPQEPFFKGLNELVATHINDDGVASVLAICINGIRIRVIDAFLLLQSGSFVFLGAFEDHFQRSDMAPYRDINVNLVASSSFVGAEAEVVKFVISNASHPNRHYPPKYPWYFNNGILQLSFNVRNVINRSVFIKDPFVFTRR